MIIVGAAMALSPAAHAALITVGPAAGCSTNNLSLALSVAALNGTDFDEIRVMEGTYTGVALSTSGISYSLTGGYNHCQLGAQALGRTNLAGNFHDSVLSISGATNAYHNVTLSHLNISNGGSSANTPLYGGGIRARDLRLCWRRPRSSTTRPAPRATAAAFVWNVHRTACPAFSNCNATSACSATRPATAAASR